MQKIQSQGVRHITIVGAGRQTSIDFWEGILGMQFVFEQPNLDNASESHASYRFEPPFGYTHADVLLEAHKIRVERDDYDIAQEHVADAIEMFVARSRPSLSDDRSAKDPY